jgi:N-acetylmuramoyl-L-alanine amidase
MRSGPIRLAYVVALALGTGLLAVSVPGTVLASSRAQKKAVPVSAPAPYVVAIDPGHGGYDPGAISPFNHLEEKKVTLSVGLDLRRLLEAQGVKVVMSRTSDVFVTIPRAEAVANDSHANVFVSLWVNDWNTPSLEGVTVFAPHPSDSTFASTLDSALGKTIASYGMGNRGVQPLPQLWVHAKMPTVTIESGFMSNENDSLLLAKPAFREALAQGIANGVLHFAPQIQTIHAQTLAYEAALSKAVASRQLAMVQARARGGLLGWALVALMTAVLLFLALYKDTLGRVLRWAARRARTRAPALARSGALELFRSLRPEPRTSRLARSHPVRPSSRRPPRGAARRAMANSWRQKGPGTRPQRVSEMVHRDEAHRQLRGHGSVYDDLSL